MKGRKAKDKNIFILLAIILISSIILTSFAKNKSINKIDSTNYLKKLDQEGQNYRLVTSADNVQVPVPKGYVASSITGENYVSPEYTYINETKTKIHNGGFVIYQLKDEELEIDPNGTSIVINDTNKDTAQSTRNQYVWVPVENIEDISRTKVANNGIMQFGQGYLFINTSITKETNEFKEPRLVEDNDKTKYYLQRYSNLDKRENYLNEQQNDFTKMIKSINKYKGFYIGRYETGDEVSHSSSNECYKNPKIVRYNSNINYVTWYDSYKDLQRLSRKTGKYVETGMLYDSLWDYTLKWLNETDTRSYEDIATDSGTWGNYCNNSLKYKSSANGAESTKNTNNTTPTGGITQISYKGETYSDSPTESNNTFDIAGNVGEWTRSRTTTYYRRSRGGYGYYYSNNVTARSVYSSYPNYSGNHIGVRGQLYIM